MAAKRRRPRAHLVSLMPGAKRDQGYRSYNPLLEQDFRAGRRFGIGVSVSVLVNLALLGGAAALATTLTPEIEPSLDLFAPITILPARVIRNTVAAKPERYRMPQPVQEERRPAIEPQRWTATQPPMAIRPERATAARSSAVAAAEAAPAARISAATLSPRAITSAHDSNAAAHARALPARMDAPREPLLSPVTAAAGASSEMTARGAATLADRASSTSLSPVSELPDATPPMAVSTRVLTIRSATGPFSGRLSHTRAHATLLELEAEGAGVAPAAAADAPGAIPEPQQGVIGARTAGSAATTDIVDAQYGGEYAAVEAAQSSGASDRQTDRRPAGGFGAAMAGPTTSVSVAGVGDAVREAGRDSDPRSATSGNTSTGQSTQARPADVRSTDSVTQRLTTIDDTRSTITAPATATHTQSHPIAAAPSTGGDSDSPVGVTHNAAIRRRVDPYIPEDLRTERFAASVVARFTIHIDGSCDVALAERSGSAQIDGVVLRALRQWRWEPAVENGSPVESTQLQEVDISIR
jgi:protein TonB